LVEILNGQTRDAGCDATRDVLGYTIRIVRQSHFRNRRSAHVSRFPQLAEMREDLIAALCAVGITLAWA